MIIDSGVTFPDNHLPGIDLIMPKIDFFHEFNISIDGLVLTHSHEDHLGAVVYLHEQLDSPQIYGTNFTLAMLLPRLKEYQVYSPEKITEIFPAQEFQVGDFKITPMKVTHSLVDCIALGIESPQGTIVHTGDFKIDRNPIDNWHFDEAKFKELGKKGVRLLMSDSTNVESAGWSTSEEELRASLEEIISQIQKGKVIVTLFSSNLHRIQILFHVAKKVGRRVVLCGRSVLTNTELAKRHGHLQFDSSQLVHSQDAKRMNPDKLLILCTGTQAESRSALSKMVNACHPDIEVLPGDSIIFSSRHILGNEKRISILMNDIYRCGARVIDYRDGLVHVSGHAKLCELESILDWVQPQCFLPVHGEYRMLVKHGELGRQRLPKTKTIVAENGDVLELSKDSFRKYPEHVAAGKAYLDEHRNLISDGIIKERRKLSSQGFVSVAAVIRKKDHKLLRGPDLIALGIPEDEIDLIELENLIEDLMNHPKRKKTVDFKSLEEEIRLLTRRFYKRSIGLKPIVIPSIYVV